MKIKIFQIYIYFQKPKILHLFQSLKLLAIEGEFINVFPTHEVLTEVQFLRKIQFQQSTILFL